MPEEYPKIKVVLVEDDKFLSEVLIFRLKDEGFDAIPVDNGETAYATIKKENPNIVLLDLLLPKKNGFEVLQELKADPVTNPIPVVILSNLGQQTDLDKGRQLGAVDYLVKANFSIGDIVAKIKQYLAPKILFRIESRYER